MALYTQPPTCGTARATEHELQRLQAADTQLGSLLERLSEHMRENQGGLVVFSPKDEQQAPFYAEYKFGEEEPGSPMVAGATQAVEGSLAGCLLKIGRDLRLL